MAASRKTFWSRQARWTAWRHNTGWWLGAFLPFAIAGSILFSGTLLVVRQSGAERPGVWLWFAGALSVAAGFGFLRARSHFFSVREGLTRLDLSLGLHNRLTAAAAGVGDYPEPRPVQDGLSWRWSKIATPFAVCALLVLSAAFVPLARRAHTSTPTEQPATWAQLESWVEQLQQSDTVEPESLEELKEKLEDLRKQDRQDWYSHSSLEAGDSLRQQTSDSLEKLRRDLDSAIAALTAMEEAREEISPTALQEMRETLSKALQGLEMGNLPFNKELLSQLKGLDPSKLKQLTPAQIAALKQKLKDGVGTCKECLQPGGKEGDGIAVLLAETGTGGISRGPGSVPLGRSEKPTQLNTETTAGVSNEDTSRSLPGDVLGVGKGEHEVDRTAFTGSTAAGAIRSSGAGGEAVWRNNATPQEREILKRFFK